MRQLIINAPRGCGQKVLDIARDHKGVNLAWFEGHGPDDDVDVAIVHVSNHRVEALMRDLESVPDTRITLVPQGVMALHPPADQAAQQVTNVEIRSPMEVFLGGLQSVGSWTGYLGYAAAGGVVAWIGLFTQTSYLLVAAMLIAPFAGPAMTAAMASARGDGTLLMRSLARYFAGLGLAVAVSALLTWLLAVGAEPNLALAVSYVSAEAVLLPLVAGAAGALHLVQSSRNSLVSGAAVGVLVAASLSPPAGTLGMGLAMGDMSMASRSGFQLVLQLIGINLSGAVVFRLYGLKPKGVRYQRGRGWISATSLGITGFALAGLLAWQFSRSPVLQRTSIAGRAVATVQQTVKEADLGVLVEAQARFTRSSVPGQHTLLTTVYVQQPEGTGLSDEEIRSRLTHRIQERLMQEYNVTPLVSVTLLAPPPGPESGSAVNGR